MNSAKLASGDNSVSAPTSPRIYVENERSNIASEIITSNENDIGGDSLNRDVNMTPQMIDENEVKLKERVAHCKNIIESLKAQLTEEKEKLKNEKKVQNTIDASKYGSGFHDTMVMQNSGNTSIYSACVESKLYCDESLIEYEKQLQKYQNTLSMAQNEKKNAIRKQMLAKAFKLKLMEVENQCNIELLRVKQSLQCLEPLQMIANKWNTSNEENSYDVNTFELMPNFLELMATSGSDVNSYKEDFDNKASTGPCQNSARSD